MPNLHNFITDLFFTQASIKLHLSIEDAKTNIIDISTRLNAGELTKSQVSPELYKYSIMYIKHKDFFELC